MARNSEKAMTALARWRQLQLKEQGKLVKERRPYLASEEFNLKKAEKWRQDVIREIAKKVTQIQNAGLGEYKIRDLNDEINKLLHEKRHWEERIVELGGPDYQKIGPRMLDREGKEVSSDRGYKYFGAAKDLPGVRELFEQEPPPPPSKTRADLMKNVDVHYYGYLDEEDESILEAERIAEQKAITAKLQEWRERRGERDEPPPPQVAQSEPEQPTTTTSEYATTCKGTDLSLDHPRFVAHVKTPSRQEIEQLIAKRRKIDLSQKYASEELVLQEKEACELLGMKS